MANPTVSATAPQFIGVTNINHIAEVYEPKIVMGAGYFRPEEMQRLGFKIITGVQFKHIKTLLVRKGMTTRRKVVGTPMNNKIGFLKERELVAKLTWNHFWDNRDNYVETPVQVEGSAEFSYPLSETAFLAITATYGEDLFANLFFGDVTNGAAGMDLYDGVHTYLAQDIEGGLISQAIGNMRPCGPLDAPTDNTDFTAWSSVEEWILSWNGSLKNQPKVLVYCSTRTGVNIKNAYANKNFGHVKANTLPNKNFTFDEYPNIEFVPSDVYGEGDRLIATVPGNFEYCVNTLSSKTKIAVREGSDNDTEDIFFQVQSIQGVRVFNILPSAFCMSDAMISPVTITGDYTKSTVVATSNDETLGTVAISGASADENGEYAQGTILTLTATAEEGAEFVKWSDGKTTNPRTVTASGLTQGYIAIFKESASEEEGGGVGE